MAITSGDILFFLTTTSGSAGFSNVGTNTSSLGKYCSTTQVTNNTLQNLFLNASGLQNSNSIVDYRGIFIVNSNPSGLVMQNAMVYCSAEVSGGATVQIAVDSVLTSGISSSLAQMDQIATPTSVPSYNGGFSFPVTVGTALSLGNISSGSGKGVWIKRNCQNTSAVDSDTIVITL